MGNNKKAGLTLKPTHPDDVGEAKKTHINFVNDAEKLSKADFESLYLALARSFASYLFDWVKTAVESLNSDYNDDKKFRIDLGTSLEGWVGHNEPTGEWNGMKIMSGTPFWKIIDNIIKKDIYGYAKKFDGILKGKLVNISNLTAKVSGVFTKKTTITGKITGVIDFYKDVEKELKVIIKDNGIEKKFSTGVYFDFSGLDFDKPTLLYSGFDDDKYNIDDDWGVMGNEIAEGRTFWPVGKSFTETVEGKLNGLVILFSIVIE